MNIKRFKFGYTVRVTPLVVRKRLASLAKITTKGVTLTLRQFLNCSSFSNHTVFRGINNYAAIKNLKIGLFFKFQILN